MLSTLRLYSCNSIYMQMFNPVIYAWGTTDTLRYHETRRGSQAVNFVQGDDGPTLPSDAKTFRLRVDNVSPHLCISHALACIERCRSTKLIGVLFYAIVFSDW